MLGSVEYCDLAVDAHGRDDVGVLWLVSSLVDFALMVDLLLDGEFDSRSVSRIAITSYFTLLLVIILLVRNNRLWELDVCDLQIIWRVTRCVCTNQESMTAEVPAWNTASM